MTTVLFADRDGRAFGALGAQTIPALMPIEAEPALERVLTALVAAGRRTALLVVGPRASEVVGRFGKGIRWGIALEIVRAEEGESAGDVLRRLEARLDGDTLVVRGDVGAHAAISRFVEAIAAGELPDAPVVAATRSSRPLGLWLVRPAALKKVELPKEPASPEWKVADDQQGFEVKGADVVLLDSVTAFHAAARPQKSAVSARAVVESGVTLGPGTAVAEEAAVLTGAKLENVVVLPRTVIPPALSLSGAAVSGNFVLDGATGATSLLSDRLPEKRRPRTASFGGRLLGTAAFFFSLPLWPIAFGWGLVANAGHATRRVMLSGNGPGTGAEGLPERRPFSTILFESGVPILRDLPLLLAVVKGKLALVGVTPRSPEEEKALASDWERARLEAPAGLLSLSRLTVPASAPVDVSRLVDSWQARTGDGGVLSRALGALFSARAFTTPRAWNPDELSDGSSA
ncbi:MAG TPA: hypothetical protein VGR00_00670 [Thermoanaerobaculia bacterium]|nr:hypothetical protein [Thermoanaerobaculia bacterium]